MTKEEKEALKINHEKAAWRRELAELDHQTLKYIDGDISADEYAEYRRRRAELRALIRGAKR